MIVTTLQPDFRAVQPDVAHEDQANGRARQMVQDLEDFLRIALPAAHQGDVRWPLRYNSCGSNANQGSLIQE